MTNNAFPAEGLTVLPTDVLIVEDDPIIAYDLEDTILNFGVASVRTASGVAQALALISERIPEFTLLDIGLVREKSFAIAERLVEMNAAFAFLTGYSADHGFSATFADKPRLTKPYSAEALRTLLMGRR